MAISLTQTQTQDMIPAPSQVEARAEAGPQEAAADKAPKPLTAAALLLAPEKTQPDVLSLGSEIGHEPTSAGTASTSFTPIISVDQVSPNLRYALTLVLLACARSCGQGCRDAAVGAGAADDDDGDDGGGGLKEIRMVGDASNINGGGGNDASLGNNNNNNNDCDFCSVASSIAVERETVSSLLSEQDYGHLQALTLQDLRNWGFGGKPPLLPP